MKIFYRISESTNSQHAAARTWQVKLPNATKKNCLLNVMDCFPNAEIKVFVDSITDETWNWLHTLPRITIQKIHEGSDAKSMRVLLREAISLEDDNEIVLFQEDDYLYLPNSEHKIIEALNYTITLLDTFILINFGLLIGEVIRLLLVKMYRNRHKLSKLRTISGWLQILRQIRLPPPSAF